MNKTRKKRTRLSPENAGKEPVPAPSDVAPGFTWPPLGCVRYLNARPLCHTLGNVVQFDHPAAIAQRLRDGDLKVANVPIMEVLENPIYDVVDGYGVCSQGPVYSVILAHRVPFTEVKTIALDSASKTSVALTHVLCRKLLKRKVEFLPSEAEADAHLWIGDQAMAYRKEHATEQFIDLGAAWHQFTRLPFVFAVWAMRKQPNGKVIANALREAAEKGIAARATIAATPEEYHYLTKNVRYEIGEREKQGISLFSQYLLECGLIGKLPELHWI